MKYLISIEASDVKTLKTGEAFAVLDYPGDVHFTAHAIVANALSALVPVLFGEAISKVETEIEGEE